MFCVNLVVTPEETVNVSVQPSLPTLRSVTAVGSTYAGGPKSSVVRGTCSHDELGSSQRSVLSLAVCNSFNVSPLSMVSHSSTV